MTSTLTHQYQVLADLVQGEFQQLETKEDEGQVILLYRVIFFTGTPPKSSKYKIKLEYQDWYPPKSSKCQPVSKFSKKKVKVPGLVPP